MEAHNQLKITPPGHENHRCYKCGWAFPNSHPSAKHRRAHKRICGTIEGFKLTGSQHSVSDEEQDHHSDEDSRTPSPKIENRRFSGSGGVGGRSNRSEDEVFSDAVTEFSESGFSPGIEEYVEGVRELEKNVQRTMAGDMVGVQSLKVAAVADSTEPLSCSLKNHGVGHPEVLLNAIASEIPFQDTRTEEAVAESRLIDCSCDVFSVKSEIPENVPRENLKGSIGDNGQQYLPDMHETKMKPNKDKDEVFLVDAEEPQTTVSHTSKQETDLKELGGRSSQYVPADALLESMQCESVELEMSPPDSAPLSEQVEHMGASVNTVQTKSDFVPDTQNRNHDDLFEIKDINWEVKQDMPVVSVANELPTLGHADDTRKDFKDHKAQESNFPTILGSANVTIHLENESKGINFQEIPSSLHSSNQCEIHSPSTNFEFGKTLHNISLPSDPVEHTEASLNTVQIKADHIQDVDSGTDGDMIEIYDTNKETEETMHLISVPSHLPVVDHADILLEDFKDHKAFNSNSSLVLGSSDVIRRLEGDNEGKVIEDSPFNLHLSKPGGSQREDMNYMEDAYNLNKASKEDLLTTEGPVQVLADASKLNTISAKAHESNVLDSPPRSSQSEKEDITHGNESKVGVTEEESSVNADTNILYEDSQPNTKLTRGEYRDENGKAAIEISDEAWNQKSTGTAADESCVTTMIANVEPGLEISGSNSPGITISDINASVPSNMMPTHPTSKKLPPVNDSQQAGTEVEMNRETKVVVKCSGAGIIGSGPSDVDNFDEPVKNLEMPIIKETGSFPTHVEALDGSSSDVKDDQSMDNGKVNLGVISQPVQESDVKLIKQHDGVSSVNLLVDSSTDSVEANWGSVSVLSAQSDAPAYMSELGKSENANLHSKTTSEKQDYKAGVLDHPSFMTLIEPRGSVDQTAAVSEIEPVQPGWFPSLTNVVNESAGRKKNEEIIAKVTNWSTGKQQSIPLKSFLGEAKIGAKSVNTETITQRDETEGKTNSVSGTTVKEVLASEGHDRQVVKRETPEEWNSPARYPVEIKKEKRKVKGWVPFVCCS